MNTKHIDAITRLEQSVSEIRNVQKLCNVPSISFGVLHQGEIIFRQSIGMRNVERQEPATPNTLYPLGSVSKGFLSAAVGIAVDDGKLRYDSKLADFVDGFRPKGDSNIANAGIAEFLRHTSGLGCPQTVVIGPHGVLLSREDGDRQMVDLLNESPTTDLKNQQRLGRAMIYNNLAYGLVGVALQSVYGIKYSEFLRERIIEPLGMKNTAVSRSDLTNDYDMAYSYCWSRSSKTFRCLDLQLTDERNTPVMAAMGMRSCVNDMLLWAAAVLSAESQEKGSDKQSSQDSKPANPLRKISPSRQPQAVFQSPDQFNNECGYAMGWSAVTLPNSMLNWLSFNVKALWNEGSKELVDEHILGKDSPRKLAVVHGGVVNGASCALYTFPETQSAVVAFSNAIQDGDASDFAARLLSQSLFDLKPKVDLTALILEERRLRREEFPGIYADWLKHRDPEAGTNVPMAEYVGVYYGLGINISITKNPEGSFSVLFNDKKESSCQLEPYSKDVVSFLPATWEEWLENSMIDWDYYEVGLLKFTRDPESGIVSGLSWKWDQGEHASWFKRADQPL